MTMSRIMRRLRNLNAALALPALAAAGCHPPRDQPENLPPAYTSNRITDRALLRAAEEIRAWAGEQAGADKHPLYSKTEVLPPVPIVQPYGVGVYQQELRLPVIFTTGPGWAGLSHVDKEARAADAFREISGRLEELDRKPALRPTLTIQTPEGMNLSWINHLEPGGKNVHGDE
jgi:hypothetical protein